MERRSHIYGVMGEFATPEQLTHAVEKVREAGYRRLDAYAPFPVEGLSQALGLKRNRSEEHTSELQSLAYLVCRLLLEKKKKNNRAIHKIFSLKIRPQSV